MFRLACLALTCALALSLAPNTTAQNKDKPARWYLFEDAGSKENHGEWTNFMPAEAGKMIKLSLADKTNPYSGKTCIKVDMKWRDPFWAGVAVSSKADYWGEEEGPAFDLRKAKKLVFYARSDNEASIQVKVAITGDKKFGDSAKIPAATKWLVLGKKWERHELDVSDMDLSRVVTPFCFVSNKDNNRSDITFYLDEIYFEMGAK